MRNSSEVNPSPRHLASWRSRFGTLEDFHGEKFHRKTSEMLLKILLRSLELEGSEGGSKLACIQDFKILFDVRSYVGH